MISSYQSKCHNHCETTRKWDWALLGCGTQISEDRRDGNDMMNSGAWFPWLHLFFMIVLVPATAWFLDVEAGGWMVAAMQFSLFVALVRCC